MVVVDDGSDPPLELPDPARTHPHRSTTESWGRAHACHVGALAAEGDVLHWLDADMLPHHDEVEAQLRWHHLLDHAVVLGSKTFVDITAGLPDLDGTLATVGRACGRPVPRPLDRPRTSGSRSTSSARRAHRERHEELPGARRRLAHRWPVRSTWNRWHGPQPQAGEDVELGYRLSQQGAVFVPDDDARSWHLGLSTLMQQQERVNRYNRPFVTDRIADMRHWRTKGRSYTVPWVEVVVDAADRTFEEVRHSVNGLLAGAAADVTVLVAGPWSRLDDPRRPPLADPDRDLRHAAGGAGRGAHVCGWWRRSPGTAFPATYRLRLPAGWSPGRDSVRRLCGRWAARTEGWSRC